MNTPYAFKIGKNSDPEMDGVRGRVGQFVFRRLNDITVVSRRPRKPTSQTRAQRDSRQRFRRATEFAKKEMMNPDRKAYYREMAVKSRLRNAYTAAIAAYMNMSETVIQSTNPTPESHVIKRLVKTHADISRNRIVTNRSPLKRYAMVWSQLAKWKSRGATGTATRNDPDRQAAEIAVRKHIQASGP